MRFRRNLIWYVGFLFEEQIGPYPYGFATHTSGNSFQITPDTKDLFEIYVKDSDTTASPIKATFELTIVFYSIFYGRKVYVDFGEDEDEDNWDEAGEDQASYMITDANRNTFFDILPVDPPVG